MSAVTVRSGVHRPRHRHHRPATDRAHHFRFRPSHTARRLLDLHLRCGNLHPHHGCPPHPHCTRSPRPHLPLQTHPIDRQAAFTPYPSRYRSEPMPRVPNGCLIINPHSIGPLPSARSPEQPSSPVGISYHHRDPWWRIVNEISGSVRRFPPTHELSGAGPRAQCFPAYPVCSISMPRSRLHTKAIGPRKNEKPKRSPGNASR